MDDMRIYELLSEHRILVGMEAGDKNEAIARLVDLLDGHPGVVDIEKVKKAIFEREELMSTGVGKGLALPHAKTGGVEKSLAALAITADPIDFETVDGEPVRIIFLLVGPKDAKSQHVRVLSRISRLMNRDDVRQRFLSVETAAELMSLLDESESQLLSA